MNNIKTTKNLIISKNMISNILINKQNIYKDKYFINLKINHDY